MLTPKWKATIHDTLPIVDDDVGFHKYLETLPSKEVEVVVKPWRNQRSNNQNKYYWAVIVEMLTEDFGDTTPEQTHEILAGIFLSEHIQVDTKHGKINVLVTRSTASLKTVEFEEYLSKIRNWASIERNCNIPLPNEVDF